MRWLRRGIAGAVAGAAMLALSAAASPGVASAMSVTAPAQLGPNTGFTATTSTYHFDDVGPHYVDVYFKPPFGGAFCPESPAAFALGAEPSYGSARHEFSAEGEHTYQDTFATRDDRGEYRVCAYETYEGETFDRAEATVLVGEPLTMSKAADKPRVPVGTDNTYTLRIDNPNPEPVTVQSVTDTLPPGFSYRAGTTTGAVTADPTVDGARLTWSEPITVPGGGNATMRFGVRTATVPGTFSNSATADAGDVAVTPVEDVAPVETYRAALVLTKKAHKKTVRGEQPNGYTITVRNPNGVAVNVVRLVDTLPTTDFEYIPKSTSGAHRTDPKVSRDFTTLTFERDFRVERLAKTSLRFRVIGSFQPGRYTNRVSGTADGGFPVRSSGRTAAIRVKPGECKVEVSLGPIKAISRCFKRERGQWVSRTRTRVNGIDVVPPGKTEVKVPLPGRGRHVTATGPVSVRLASGGLRQQKDWIKFPVRRLRWDAGRLFTFKPEKEGTFKGILLKGAVSVDWGGGGAKLKVMPSLASKYVSLEAGLKDLRKPTRGVGFTLATDNARGVHLDSFHIQADVMKLVGYRLVESVSLTYSNAEKKLTGTGKLVLPAVGEPSIEGRAGIFLDPVRPAQIGATFNFPTPGRPLGTTGVFLQSVGADVGFDKSFSLRQMYIKGSLGVSAGPKLDLRKIGIGKLAAVEGNGSLTIKNFSLRTFPLWTLDGSLKLIGQQVSSGKIAFGGGTGMVDMSGYLDLSIKGFGVEGDMKGWVQRKKFSASASGRGLFAGHTVSGTRVLVTSKGIGGCNTYFGRSVGWRYRYGDKVPRPFLGCDLGPVSVSTPSGASAAAQSFTVGANEPLVMFAATGTGAPPRVRVSGPGGRTITTPNSPNFVEGPDYLILRYAEDATTYVVVNKPAAGRWTMDPLPGSVPIQTTQRANALAPASVTAQVTGKGHRRTLSWKLKPIAGQRVTFFERGQNVTQQIATTARARGSVRFTPTSGPRARRQIVAIVEQDELPRAQIVAARYLSPGPFVPARPRGLTARRRGGRLIVGWKRVAGVSGYELTVKLADGAVLSGRQGRRARRANLRIAGRPRGAVILRGLGPAGEPGRPATVRIR